MYRPCVLDVYLGRLLNFDLLIGWVVVEHPDYVGSFRVDDVEILDDLLEFDDAALAVVVENFQCVHQAFDIDFRVLVVAVIVIKPEIDAFNRAYGLRKITWLVAVFPALIG